MNYTDWYTDTMDVYRVTPAKTGNLTRHSREKVLEGIPCRIYTSNDSTPAMSQTAASIKQTSKVALDNSYVIKEGDELIITRGGRLGYAASVTRAFAGAPHIYYEPFGAVIPGLAHQEIKLLEEERVS